MPDSRRLDVPSVAGIYLRKVCARCGGQGCPLCNEGYIWISPYAQGRGEQGDTFEVDDLIWDSPPCEAFALRRLE